MKNILEIKIIQILLIVRLFMIVRDLEVLIIGHPTMTEIFEDLEITAVDLEMSVGLEVLDHGGIVNARKMHNGKQETVMTMDPQ